MNLLKFKFFDTRCLLEIASCFKEANFLIQECVRVKMQ